MLSRFRILFLGEHLSWSRVLQALDQVPEIGIRLHRVPLIAEALESIEHEPWDAALVAVSQSAALEFIREVRARREAMPIWALVAENDVAASNAAREHGATACLPLPMLNGQRLLEWISAGANERGAARSESAIGMDPHLGRASDLAVGAKSWIEVCHILTNLLCIISGSADLLAERLGESEAATRHITHIQDASRGAAVLLRRVLSQISDRKTDSAGKPGDSRHSL